MPDSWIRHLKDAADILKHARSPAELVRALLPNAWLPRRVLNDAPSSRERVDPADLAQSLRKLRNELKATVIDDEGRVDYERLATSDAFEQLRATSRLLRNLDLEALHDDASRIAFWINIYNVLAIHGVLALGIRESVMEIPSFFGTVAYAVGDFVLTLDEIENGVLRRNAPHPATGARPFEPGDPRLSLCPSRVDPRIHSALVCASVSCPPVAFYEAEALDAQLDAATASYVAAEVQVDEARARVRLPITFRYYERDYGGRSGIVSFLVDYATGAQEKALRRAFERDYVFDYHRYDWSLNSIA